MRWGGKDHPKSLSSEAKLDLGPYDGLSGDSIWYGRRNASDRVKQAKKKDNQEKLGFRAAERAVASQQRFAVYCSCLEETKPAAWENDFACEAIKAWWQVKQSNNSLDAHVAA